MAVGDLVTGNWQMEFAGQHWGDGTGIDFVKLDGLGAPDYRSNDVVRPRDHGMIAGTDFLGGRTVAMDLELGATSAATLETSLNALQQLGTTVSQTEQWLVFQLPGQVKRFVKARLRARAVPIDIAYEVGRIVPIALQFYATDPRIYALTPISSSTFQLPTSSGGLGWPLGAWPIGWGSATSGQQVIVNAGTFATRPVVTFTGPLTSPNVQNVTSGQTWACTFDLQAGDTLVVDFDARTVLLNGTASRYSFVTSTSVWWELAPGNSTMQIGASAGSGTASLVAYSAWA